MLDSDIAVLGPAERLEFLAKCNDAGPHFGIILVIWMQECDAPHALWLLRSRRERPRGCAAEQRDELATLMSSIGDFLPYALLAPPTGPCAQSSAPPACCRAARKSLGQT